MHRAVKVYVFIPITIGVRGQIIYTTHGYRSCKKIRPPEIHICCMESTKRSSASDDACFVACIMLDIGYNLPGYILVELLMAYSLMTGMHFAVEPAFRIDAVDR